MANRPKAFRPAHLPSQKETQRQYEQWRGSARERGYDAQWDRASHAFKCEHPLCLGCEAVGRVEPATVVDHVEPHRGDMAKFWDRSMWQASCKWHHDVVKQQLDAMFCQGKIALAELWLDSPSAQRITRLVLPTST